MTELLHVFNYIYGINTFRVCLFDSNMNTIWRYKIKEYKDG